MTRRPAFTLFEILLVLAILVVFAALSFPSIDSMYAGYRLTASSDMLRAAWAEGRAYAVEQGRPYRFAIVAGRGNWRVAPEGNDFWSGGEPPIGDDPASRPFVREEALPRNVRFASLDAALNGSPSGDSSLPVGSFDAGMWQSVVTFLPDGTSREDVEILLTTPGSRPLVVRLRALTGVVAVKRYDAEGGRP